MRVQAAASALQPGSQTAVTIGNFDGLHRGHIHLLRSLRKAAASEGLLTTLVTFDPHPLRLLRPVAMPKLLQDTAQKLRELQRTGLVDVCVVLPFDEARSRQEAPDFVHEVLVSQLQARRVMVGADFRFGRGRAGDVAVLRRLGERHGFIVDDSPLVCARSTPASQPCSSTQLRRLVADGQMEQSHLLLDRPHTVTGRVVATCWPTRGRGTPTSVIRIPQDRALPLEGSFAGTLVAIDGRERSAGISIRPGITVGHEALLDVHIVDRVEELMDQTVAVRFHRRVWSTGPSELFAQVDGQAVAEATAAASGGWGSAA